MAGPHHTASHGRRLGTEAFRLGETRPGALGNAQALVGAARAEVLPACRLRSAAPPSRSVTPARKIAPALAVGCTCIVKPAEETPGTTLEMARALTDAGLPKGVLKARLREGLYCISQLIPEFAATAVPSTRVVSLALATCISATTHRKVIVRSSWIRIRFSA